LLASAADAVMVSCLPGAGRGAVFVPNWPFCPATGSVADIPFADIRLDCGNYFHNSADSHYGSRLESRLDDPGSAAADRYRINKLAFRIMVVNISLGSPLHMVPYRCAKVLIGTVPFLDYLHKRILD